MATGAKGRATDGRSGQARKAAPVDASNSPGPGLRMPRREPSDFPHPIRELLVLLLAFVVLVAVVLLILWAISTTQPPTYAEFLWGRL